jgi:hypothetical protein
MKNKNFSRLSTILVGVILVFTLVGCDKDGNGDEKNPFIGIWYAVDAPNEVFEFTSNNWTNTIYDEYSSSGTYIYNGNNATLRAGYEEDIEENIFEFSAYISGNKLFIEDYFSEVVEFSKNSNGNNGGNNGGGDTSGTITINGYYYGGRNPHYRYSFRNGSSHQVRVTANGETRIMPPHTLVDDFELRLSVSTITATYTPADKITYFGTGSIITFIDR